MNFDGKNNWFYNRDSSFLSNLRTGKELLREINDERFCLEVYILFYAHI